MNLPSELHKVQGQKQEIADAEPSLLAALPLLRDGLSIYSVSKELQCPRSTLREQLLAFERIDLPDRLKEVFISREGQEFLTRLSIAAHLQFRSLGACGLRQIKDFFVACGLDQLVGVSVGSQWSLSKQIDEGIVEFGSEELANMSAAVQGKSITAALDENFHEGPCLVGIEPVSNFILVEDAADSRETADWQKALDPVLALLGVKIKQVTSDSATAIISLCEKVFEAHHSPDLFHVLYDFRRTFRPLLRRVYKDILRSLCASEREEDALIQMQNKWNSMTPSERGRGRPPDFDKLLQDQSSQQQLLFRGLSDLEKNDKELSDALRNFSNAYHPVSIDTGVRTGRSNLEESASIFAAKARSIIEKYSLPEEATKALEKFLRMAEKMAATLDYVSAQWRVSAMGATTSMQDRCCLETKLIGAAYLERIAKKQGTLKRHEMLEKSRLLVEEATRIIGEEKVTELNTLAIQMAQDFQRSSSMVEGRNGVLALRHHAFHELSSLKRKVLTTLHNHFIKRADGTTAAERFSNTKSRNLLDWLCEKIRFLPKAGGRKQVACAS